MNHSTVHCVKRFNQQSLTKWWTMTLYSWIGLTLVCAWRPTHRAAAAQDIYLHLENNNSALLQSDLHWACLNQSGTVFSFLDDKASLFFKKTWTNNELDKSYVKSEPYLQHPVLSRSNCCRCRPVVTHCMSLWKQSHTVCCSLSHWQLIYSVFKVWGRGRRVLMKLRFQSKII